MGAAHAELQYGGDEAMDDALALVDERRLDRDESVDPMALLAYYRRLLPFRSLYTWLNQDVALSRSFSNREFAFTLQNDAYLRYQSFSSWDEWKKEVCRLNPSRFEIGPVYSAKPKDRKTMQKTMFRPTERELVFDIDMTDYDEIRTCCSGKDICPRCWKLIAVAVDVLDSVLREDFGFCHLLWVYSGRRGIHCWVSDLDAMSLSDEARKALVGWIEVIRGSANQDKKVHLGSALGGHARLLHPSIRRAVGVDVLRGTAPGAMRTSGLLQSAFVDVILKDQDCFRARDRWETLVALLPTSEPDAVARLRTRWSDTDRTSEQKWEDVLDTAGRAPERARTAWVAALEDIVLQYTYPRIDTEVSKRQNHLLKSPFVVHPSTGRVCVPLDVEQIRAFDPQRGAPTVAQLLRELNEHEVRKNAQSGADSSGSPRGEWEKTGLRPFVHQFDQFCARILRDKREAKRAVEKHSIDF
ncbi:p48 polypeptide of DNA primase [Malassezia sp. CBS 17886]|nr:p48 polypeptide of DNA primase [Malassezia sp. CBS 17886]